MSELDQLREPLIAKGMEYREHEAPATDCIAFFDGNGWHDCWESVDGEVNVTFSMTPAQAVEATMGREDAYTREDVESAFVSGYSLGTLPVGSDPRWDENVQTVDEHMAELGWVRKATLGRGTCKVEFMHGYTDPYVSTRYMVELSCHTLDDWPESEPPIYCPWRGRKVVGATTNDVDAEVTDG